MQIKQLGNSDLNITTIGFGAWAIGGLGYEFSWGPQNDRDSIDAIHRALDLGINWIDTAPGYGVGHSEEIIAKALAGWSGSTPYIFTKCGLRWDDQGKISKNLSAESIQGECEDSLRRLKFIAPSLSADEAVRDAFFESLHDDENRRTESWVIDAVTNLHHPSRLAQSEKYLLPSLELLEEIQITGDIFFPRNWLGATLGNHYSAAAAQTVRDFLAQRPDYNPQLRMKILQAADGLFRASARLQPL